MSHVIGTPLSRSKGQRSRSPGRFTQRDLRVRRLQWSAWERIRRGKVLLRCICSAAREALGRPPGEERGGDILCQLVYGNIRIVHRVHKKLKKLA